MSLLIKFHYLKIYVLFADTIEFTDYKEFLLYIFNSVHNTGKLDDVIFKVKNQPKAKPFDYNYSTQEGNKQKYFSIY